MKITNSSFWKIALGCKMESACYGLVKCRRPAMGLLNTSARLLDGVNVPPLTD